VRQLASARLADIPVILLSARPDVAVRAKQLLVADFLPKPLSFEALLHVVQNRATTVVTAVPAAVSAR
jgi:FixJ family two-component response regulator